MYGWVVQIESTKGSFDWICVCCTSPDHDDSHDMDKLEVKNPLEDLDPGLVRRLYGKIHEIWHCLNQSIVEEREYVSNKCGW